MACVQAAKSGAVWVMVGFAMAAHAETATPTATTATYGNWTVGCTMAAQADGSAPVQVCQMVTRLNLKGKDGQIQPLLAISIGTPPGAKGPHLSVQVPTDVALRDGLVISVDKGPADAAAPKPQEALASLTYLTCAPQGCVSDTDATSDLLAKLATLKVANVTFTVLAGAKKIVVPVSLDGFGDGLAALQANTK